MKTKQRARILEAIRRAIASQISSSEREALFPKKEIDILHNQWEQIDTTRKQCSDELVETFKKECERLPATVHLLRSRDRAADVLSSIIKKNAAKKIIKWTSPVFKGLVTQLSTLAFVSNHPVL